MGISYSFFVQGTPLEVHGIYRDSKPKLAKKLITDGNHVSFVNEKGKMYSSRVVWGSRSYGNRWHGHIALIREAIALGALPKSNVLHVAKLEEKRREKSNQAYAARDALQSAEAAGVKLPSATVKLLQRKARAA